MSTKANFKAIVLILTVALTSLFISPSNAVVQSDSLTSSYTVVTQYLGETSTANSPEIRLAFVGQNAGDTMSVTAALVSMPSGNTKMPILQLTQTSNANVDTSSVLDGAVPLSYEFKNNWSPVANVSASSNLVFVQAYFKLYLDSPNVPGTYRIRLVPQIVGGGGALNATNLDIYINIVDPAPNSASAVLTSPSDTSSATDSVVLACYEATSNPIAFLKETPRNSAGVATYAESITAVAIGSGTIGTATPNGVPISGWGAKALQLRAGDSLAIYGDGTSGITRIELYSTSGKFLVSKTIQFVKCVNPIFIDFNKNFTGVFQKGLGVKLAFYANVPGYTVFSVDGKKIPGCQKVFSTGTPSVSICNWKPASSGALKVRLTFYNSGYPNSPVDLTTTIGIERRTGTR